MAIVKYRKRLSGSSNVRIPKKIAEILDWNDRDNLFIILNGLDEICFKNIDKTERIKQQKPSEVEENG